MSIIQVQNLSFTYPGSYEPVFADLSFTMDTSWRLGLVGRNGRGKTTLMRLLTGELTGSGQILSSVRFDLFPMETDENRSALDCMKGVIAPFEQWEKQMDELLAASLSKPAHLYIWDEPLNYIDLESREQIEGMLTASEATMIFVEHDQVFAGNIARKTVRLR